MPDRLAQLERLHAADPDDVDLRYMIALEHAKAGRADEAIAWLDRVLERDAHYHYAYYQKAKLLHSLGRDDEVDSVLALGISQAQGKADQKALSELQQLRQTMG